MRKIITMSGASVTFIDCIQTAVGIVHSCLSAPNPPEHTHPSQMLPPLEAPELPRAQVGINSASLNIGNEIVCD